MGPGHAIIVLSDLAVAIVPTICLLLATWRINVPFNFLERAKSVLQKMKFDTYDSSGKVCVLRISKREVLSKHNLSANLTSKEMTVFAEKSLNKKTIILLLTLVVDNNFLFYNIFYASCE